jgi:hypothetical protein
MLSMAAEWPAVRRKPIGRIFPKPHDGAMLTDC